MIESDRGWGFEVAAGFLVPLATRFALSPGIRYGRTDMDFPSQGNLETRHMIVGLAFILGF